MDKKISTFEFEKGRVFVAGLFWQPLIPTTLKEARADAAEQAEQMGFDLAIFRKNDAIQVGFCASEDDAKEGYLSIAAVISKSLEVDEVAKEAIMAMPLGDGSDRWLYFAQKDGVILADGDFVGTEDEVRAAMHSHYSHTDWAYVVAPLHWGFRGALERSLTDFLPKDKKGRIRYHKWWAISPIKVNASAAIKKALPYAIVALGLIALAGFGMKAYTAYQHKLEMQRQAEAAAAAALQEAITATPPWHSESNPVDFAKNCIAAVDTIPLAPGGWTLNAATCSVDGTMQAAWSRPVYSTISLLRAIVPEATIATDGNSAYVTRQFVPGAPLTEEAMDLTNMVAEIHDRAQRLGLPITITDIPVPPPQQGLPPQAWKSSKWELVSSVSPNELMKWFAMPGLRLSSLSVQFANGINTWKMEGLIYAKNQ